MGKKKLGEVLRSRGAVTRAQLAILLEKQSQQSQPDRLGTLACGVGYLTPKSLALALGAQLQIPVVLSLERMTIDRKLFSLIPEAICRKFSFVPLGLRCAPRALVVAMADPTQGLVIRALEQISGLPVLASVAPESEIKRAFKRLRSEMFTVGFDALEATEIEHSDVVAPNLAQIGKETKPRPLGILRWKLGLEGPHSSGHRESSEASVV